MKVSATNKYEASIWIKSNDTSMDNCKHLSNSGVQIHCSCTTDTGSEFAVAASGILKPCVCVCVCVWGGRCIPTCLRMITVSCPQAALTCSLGRWTPRWRHRSPSHHTQKLAHSHVVWRRPRLPSLPLQMLGFTCLTRILNRSAARGTTRTFAAATATRLTLSSTHLHCGLPAPMMAGRKRKHDNTWCVISMPHFLTSRTFWMPEPAGTLSALPLISSTRRPIAPPLLRAVVRHTRIRPATGTGSSHRRQPTSV